VARDEPHVSVGSHLDGNFGYSFEENPKYGGGAQQQKKEEKVRVESVVKTHLGLKCKVKSYFTENKAKEDEDRG
jgi:hypothetical protein